MNKDSTIKGQGYIFQIRRKHEGPDLKLEINITKRIRLINKVLNTGKDCLDDAKRLKLIKNILEDVSMLSSILYIAVIIHQIEVPNTLFMSTISSSKKPIKF